MVSPRGWLLAICIATAALGALKSAFDIMRGNIAEGITPGWTDFAIAHPEIFALILVACGLFPPLRLVLENV